ncbi:CAP domain-containing protein [Polaromonas sp. YR568]|uniref:CAP domain-containing protein n=1 Tax=Polaromonas sp. YR568 TaxID=1855301 RepID=UPI001587E191|nr:CAP domain-containing protein [Polaromonas sp. YR568]
MNTLRQQGCDKSTPPVGPLRENAALSRAAALIARGSKLDAALKAAGYRAIRATEITVRGPAGAAALSPKSLGKTCRSATTDELQDAGFHQSGSQTWVVMAVPFSPPDAALADDVEARVLTLVNAARARPQRCGSQSFAAAPPLRLNPVLQNVASGHAAEMARYSYFSHTGRDGNTVDGRATLAGYPWRQIGENIAAGQMTADTVVRGWINSPGHCANIMSPAYSEMGAAFVANPQSSMGIYWAQVFGSAR